jgi:hypothetical protein
MDGIMAILDELYDPVQSPIATRDFGGKMRNQTQLKEPYDISEIKAVKFLIVGNIQEDSIWVRRRRHVCASYPVLWRSRVLLLDWKVGP